MDTLVEGELSSRFVSQDRAIQRNMSIGIAATVLIGLHKLKMDDFIYPRSWLGTPCLSPVINIFNEIYIYIYMYIYTTG